MTKRPTPSLRRRKAPGEVSAEGPESAPRLAGAGGRGWLTPERLGALLVAAVAFAVYANTLGNGFVDDDEAQVLRNPWIRDFGHLDDIFGKSVWSFLKGVGANNYYRPLMHVIYLLTHAIFGLRPWGFHLVSVLLHAANSLLVFRLATKRLGDSSRTAPSTGSFAAALLFATHPVHTEAVAWIAAVPELAFTLACLVALLLWNPPDTFDTRRAVGTGIAFFCALLCKETAIVLPLLLLAHDIALRPGGRGPWARRRGYLALAVAFAIYLPMRVAALWSTLVPVPKLQPLSDYQLAINVLPLLRDYVLLLMAPIRLSFWHAFEPISSVGSAPGIQGLAVVVFLAAAFVLAWKRSRRSFVALTWVLVPLLPAFWIAALPMKPFAERYLYLPSVGFSLLAGIAIDSRALRHRRLVTLGVASVLLLYGLVTVRRNRVWESPLTLFADTVAKAPDAEIPRYDLAIALSNTGRVDEAIGHYRILVERFPEHAKAQSGLGAALLLEGKTDEAIARLRRAIELEPTSLESYNDLAVALKKLGRREESLALYRRALEIDPDFADAHFNLASGLSGMGEHAGAIVHYREAVRLRPGDAYYRAVLGIELAEQGRTREAITEFEAAVRLAPEESAYRNDLERARQLAASGAEKPLPSD